MLYPNPRFIKIDYKLITVTTRVESCMVLTETNILFGCSVS